MISALRVMVSALQAMISADRMVISARANGSIFLINGPTTTKFRHDNLLTSQNNFPTSLGNFIPSANNTRTLPHPSASGIGERENTWWLMSFISGLVTFTNGALIYLRGIQRAPFDPKTIQDDLQTSQNNFPISLGNVIPSANNNTTFPHPSGNGRINGASKLHCCYERMTEGLKFPSENRFGSRMLIQSSPAVFRFLGIL